MIMVEADYSSVKIGCIQLLAQQEARQESLPSPLGWAKNNHFPGMGFREPGWLRAG